MRDSCVSKSELYCIYGKTVTGPLNVSRTPWTPSLDIEPGQWVRVPARPDWGIGQVQSIVGDRITVNFEDAGKMLINVRVVTLEIAEA